MSDRYHFHQFGEFDETIIDLRNEGKFHVAKALLSCRVAWETVNSWQDEDGVYEIIHGFIEVPNRYFSTWPSEHPKLYGEMIDALFSLSTDGGRIESLRIVRGWPKSDQEEIDEVSAHRERSRRIATEQVRSLLSEGRETPSLEFKSTFAGGESQSEARAELKMKTWIAICAFLNARGGDLLIGVSDKAEIIGLAGDLKRSGSIDRLIQDVEVAFGDKIRPRPVGVVDIEPVEVDEHTILSVRVRGDSTQIYYLDGDIYVRGSAKSGAPLKPSEIASWTQRRLKGEV